MSAKCLFTLVVHVAFPSAQAVKAFCLLIFISDDLKVSVFSSHHFKVFGLVGSNDDLDFKKTTFILFVLLLSCYGCKYSDILHNVEN